MKKKLKKKETKKEKKINWNINKEENEKGMFRDKWEQAMENRKMTYISGIIENNLFWVGKRFDPQFGLERKHAYRHSKNLSKGKAKEYGMSSMHLASHHCNKTW